MTLLQNGRPRSLTRIGDDTRNVTCSETSDKLVNRIKVAHFKYIRSPQHLYYSSHLLFTKNNGTKDRKKATVEKKF